MCCLACIVPRMMNVINIKSNANDESRCRVEKGGGESTDTQILKLLQVFQVQYCQQCVKLWW